MGVASGGRKPTDAGTTSYTKPNKKLRYVIGRGLALTKAYETSNAQTITRMRINPENSGS
jgi:hypothetical protein